MNFHLNKKLIIFIIILVSIGLRIYNIEQKNLWFDEVYSWKISQGSVEQVVIDASGDIHPPFYYMILKFWTGIFSDSIFSMRMLSVMLSILSIFFIYKISKIFLRDDRKIIIVLLLYAVSPLNIYYSQEVRMQNLNLLLCLGSVYYFFNFMMTDSKRSGAAYVLFTALALYTHYFSFFILFTELVLILIFYFYQKTNRKILIGYLICFITINLLYIPWYEVFFMQISKGQPWRTQQSVIETLNGALNYFRDSFLSPYYTFENFIAYYFSTLFGFFIVTFIILSVLKTVKSKTFLTDRHNSIALIFLIPLLIGVIISFRQSIVLSRYLSILLPYLFILVIYFSFKILSTKTAFAVTSFLLLASIYGIYIYFNNSFKSNDYRKIISYLEENFSINDKLIAEPHYMGWGIDYYLKHNKSNLKAPEILGWDLNMQLESLKGKNDFDNVWFVLDYSALNNTNFDSLSFFMNEMGYKRTGGKSFYVIPAKVSVEHFVKSVN